MRLNESFELHPGVDIKFPKYISKVVLYSFFADKEVFGYLPVFFAAKRQYIDSLSAGPDTKIWISVRILCKTQPMLAA